MPPLNDNPYEHDLGDILVGHTVLCWTIHATKTSCCSTLGARQTNEHFGKGRHLQSLWIQRSCDFPEVVIDFNLPSLFSECKYNFVVFSGCAYTLRLVSLLMVFN